MKQIGWNIKKVIICIVLVFSSVLCYFFASASFRFVKADSAQVEYFLPVDNMQYKTLNAPIDVYSDDDVTAIASGDQKLYVYYDGKYTELDGFSAIKQVKKFDNATLLVSDFGRIYSISLLNNFNKLELSQISGNYFDVNKEYLIAAYSRTAEVYKINNNGFNYSSSFSLDADKPVAINDNNEIFFYNSNGICKLSATKTNEEPVVLSTDVPSKMIADKSYIYFLTENQTHVTKLNISTLEKTTLTITELDKDYQLGNLVSPSGINFKNGNLLLTDTELDAVQEFKIEEDQLVFTGFAIASGKTAYNRTSKNAVSIEYYNNNVAVLDENKLLITKTETENPYDRSNFKNYTKIDTFKGTMPNTIAIGKDTVLLSYNHEKNNGYLKMLNLSDGTLSDRIDVFNYVIQEICYQSGNYYVLLIRLEGVTHKETLVYKLSETDRQLSEKVLTSDFNATAMTVDVFGNIYLADSNGKICFYEKSNKYSEKAIGTIKNIKKMSTDLGGVLFVLSDGISYYDGNTFKSSSITPPETSDKIKSFAMSFENKNVYLLYNGKEYVCKTKALDNLSLSEVTVSNKDFITTSNTTKQDTLKIATVDKSANVYSVLREKDGDRFIYIGLAEKQTEYAHICDIKMSDKLTLSVLAGQNQIVFVNNKEVTLSLPKFTDAPEKAYVATDVNAYYIPIILKDIDETEVDYMPINFALTDNGNLVRLTKSTVISPLSTVKFLTREQSGETLDIYFYFASFTVNGNHYSGYIPVSFTVPVLAEDFSWKEYSIETVKKTDVYIDALLSGESIYSLNDGEQVIITEKGESVYKVKIQINENEFIEGYINVNAIKNKAETTVRNVIILIIISICILGTSLFLVLRKKPNN